MARFSCKAGKNLELGAETGLENWDLGIAHHWRGGCEMLSGLRSSKCTAQLLGVSRGMGVRRHSTEGGWWSKDGSFLTAMRVPHAKTQGASSVEVFIRRRKILSIGVDRELELQGPIVQRHRAGYATAAADAD